MAPTFIHHLVLRDDKPTKSGAPEYVNNIEAWGEGFNFGGLIILMLIVICNLRRKVLLHKLILLEQFLALFHATIIFVGDPVWGWYLSSTVVALYISYFLHNVIAWMKVRPFLSKKGSWIFLGTLILVEPYWGVALWTNYEHFNGLGDDHYEQIRPYETFAKEPWWIFTLVYLVWVLKKRYDFGLRKLMVVTPRFGVLITCMVLSICFAVIDGVVVGVNLNKSNGINPYWRMSLVFKCASDTIFLDDFKKVLDKLVSNALQRATQDSGLSNSRNRNTIGTNNTRQLLSGRGPPTYSTFDTYDEAEGAERKPSIANSLGHDRSLDDDEDFSQDRTLRRYMSEDSNNGVEAAPAHKSTTEKGSRSIWDKALPERPRPVRESLAKMLLLPKRQSSSAAARLTGALRDNETESETGPHAFRDQRYIIRSTSIRTQSYNATDEKSGGKWSSASK